MKICWDKLKLFHALLINFTGESLREYRIKLCTLHYQVKPANPVTH